MLNKQLLIIFFIIINILPILSFGQCEKDWIKKVSFVTMDNDTIKGYVKEFDSSLYLQYKKFVYRDMNCDKQKIAVNEVKFVLNRFRKYVIKKKADGFYAIIELVLDHEKVKYYHGTYIVPANSGYLPNGQYHYSGEREIEYHVVEMNDRVVKIKKKKKNYLIQFEYLFGDCPELKEKILAEEYSWQNLHTLVASYIKWYDNKKIKTPIE